MLQIFISLLGILTFLFLLIFFIDWLGNKFQPLQRIVFRGIPIIILVISLLYMITSYIKLINYINQSGNGPSNLISLLFRGETFTTFATFFALLTFYQLLQDRYEKVFSPKFTKISNLDLITRDIHNQILSEERKKTTKKLNAEIKKLKQEIKDLKKC